jgi:hypothetical protein
MRSKRLFDRLFGLFDRLLDRGHKPSRKPPRRPRSAKLGVEQFEDRMALSS